MATRLPSPSRSRPHSVTPVRVLRSTLLAVVGVTAGALTFAPPVSAQTGRGEAAAPEPPDNGDAVTVTGQVTDSEGRPVAGVHVVFEAHRSYFSLRRFEHRVKDFRRVETVTDETGRYRLEWLWDDYFNRFLVGVETPGRHSAVGATTNRTPQGTQGSGDNARASPYLVEQTDLRSRLARSGSAVVPLVIEDTELLEAVRRFESSLTTEDQRRVYRDLGYPDEVQVFELAAGREASWWYFERGEVYRFADGDLQEIEPFEPVTGF